MKSSLVEFDEHFLDLTWKWLNDPVIAKMVSANITTRADQNEWFKKIPALSDYFIWGFEFENIPIGVCGIKKVTNFDCEYWGYIGEKVHWGKGIGTDMMILMENEAKKRKLQSIWLQVNNDNTRAVNLYMRTGYKIERRLDDKLLMRKHL